MLVECIRMILAQATSAAWTLDKHTAVLKSVLHIILIMLSYQTRLRMSEATQWPHVVPPLLLQRNTNDLVKLLEALSAGVRVHPSQAERQHILLKGPSPTLHHARQPCTGVQHRRFLFFETDAAAAGRGVQQAGNC